MQLIEKLKENESSMELEKGFEIPVWDKKALIDIFEIDDETLKYLIERTGKYCSNLSIKKSFNINFIFVGESFQYLTVVGLYVFVESVSTLKKYNHLDKIVPELLKLSNHHLLRYMGFKFSPSKEKKLNNIPEEFRVKSFEDMAAIKAKKIAGDLKIPNYDIEDKTHLFYRKSVVITGVFNNFPVREEMAEWIKEVGGNNNGDVSGKTDFVVLGKNAGWKKLQTIEKKGIKTLTEDEFIALFPNKKTKLT